MSDNKLKMQSNNIYVPNNSEVLNLNPRLALEIGLGESIILLQLDKWISMSDSEFDGKVWTYKSLRTMHKTFPFWEITTINRKIAKLEDMKLIITRNENSDPFDKTRWFALWLENIVQLSSIKVMIA